MRFPGAFGFLLKIGILSLTREGKPVDFPDWDSAGLLWLQRKSSSQQSEKNFLGVKVYALLEDGIPLWLRTEVELAVAGKSREQDIGAVLPQGWRLAAVNSPIPVLLDESRQMKAQVRPGKWTVQLDAFRLDNSKEFRYPPTVKPAVADELVGFRARPDFRMIDIVGPTPIDLTQTTFPENGAIYRSIDGRHPSHSGSSSGCE
jgi:hypothetical protein